MLQNTREVVIIKRLSTIILQLGLCSPLILQFLSSASQDGNYSILMPFEPAVANAASLTYSKADDKGSRNHNADTDTGANDKECITYDKTEKTIIISCGQIRLSDIYSTLRNPSVIDKQPHKVREEQSDQQKQGIWLLNANLTINKGATLVVDPTDTKWLKIISDGKTLSYGIHVYGSLKLDSVRVTSWNPSTNHYVSSNGSRETSGKIVHLGIPRPYIRVESHGIGTVNITNSEIAYLGYEGGWGSGTSGIHYHNAGHNSIIRNNNIHHLYFGFYSVSLGGMVIENNFVHDNGHYGIDPHTATHDMLIRNNTVYNNNGTGIICSLDCYRILIENNNVYNNTGSGIVFSRNMTHSIARNNYIHEQPRAILISRSNNNQVYNNTIVNTDPGIAIVNASLNKIHDNHIKNATNAFSFKTGAHDNNVYANAIIINSSLPIRENVTTYDNSTHAKETNNIVKDNNVVKLTTFITKNRQ
jgi:poly(beta-D-mannuronate) C5 epimerase